MPGERERQAAIMLAVTPEALVPDDHDFTMSTISTTSTPAKRTASEK